eukprot:9625544-Alexandrium_andersonii.AAC.1
MSWALARQEPTKDCADCGLVDFSATPSPRLSEGSLASHCPLPQRPSRCAAPNGAQCAPLSGRNS